MASADISRGPHLVTAVFCEKVLHEQDGVLRLIRVIDQMTQSASGPDAPEQMPPFMLEGLTLVVTIKADEARGRYGVRVSPEAPGGIQMPSIEQAITLKTGPGGVNLVMPIVFPINQEGSTGSTSS
jgi:hypothetical protein